MKFDLHTHHERCGHADGAIEAYIQAAIQAGLQVIGISDHSPYFASDKDQPLPHIAMARSEFPNYVREVLELKAKYEGRIEVLLGVESDYYPELWPIYKAEYDNYPMDYIIGSVHQTRGVSIFNKKRWNNLSEKEKIREKEHYYHLIAESARCGLFQSLGHIDAMKGYYPAFSDIPAAEAIDKALRTIADAGVAIEINTSGKTKYAGGWYPSDDILERACHFGVTVTFGSDAHLPSRIGDDFELVRTRLREIGYTSWVFFRQKRLVTVQL
ncbi:histidinol-phosphatase [Paenibacillus sp. SYP-B4298]|uniref:histidinol-phosphatase n=1 Tax=Paenibacillus sp. SYP-B4298 TaxID=2996034 RepID=UPI0022DD31B9|nr:histidinol-phosphatase [Paenibacillus sp. SYP-B4298]